VIAWAIRLFDGGKYTLTAWQIRTGKAIDKLYRGSLAEATFSDVELLLFVSSIETIRWFTFTCCH
jgi:hypothetical protein